jgi:hypothetical protein
LGIAGGEWRGRKTDRLNIVLIATTAVAKKEFSCAVDEGRCQACPLWKTSVAGHIRRSGIYGRGSGTSGLWLYGDDYRVEDVKLGMPLMGQAGRLLTRIFHEIGLNEREAFFHERYSLPTV